MAENFNENNTIDQLKILFRQWCGEDAENIGSLPESGSVRRYYRINGKNTKAVGVYNPDMRENHAFFYLSSHFKSKNINVPEVFITDADKGIYLEEDLGDTLLYNYYTEHVNDEESILNIYKSVIREMPALQIKSAEGLDFDICYPRAAFDRQSMIWDLNYFKSYFLKLTGVHFYEQDLEDDFNALINFLLKANDNYFLFRDFQSRNIMLHNGKIYFIDYQGGRKGALQYDIASLLFEAKTNLPPAMREELLAYYIEIFSKVPEFDSENFSRYYYGFVLIRMLQALGAYGFRGYFERKHFFLQSIPPAVKNLKWFIENVKMDVHLPQLWKCFEQIVNSEFLKDYEQSPKELTVSVNSFSYKSGIPIDNTGNGGGFVFDCRALPNPGRFEQYKKFTGKDFTVIEFLNEKEEVKDFINLAFQMVQSSIKNYKERNFTSLTINFGCTGGQHRSVFCAEEMALRIKNSFDVKVNLRHRGLENKK
jgi:aminoglycoside/choline kinase family phosphotransferase